MNITEMMVESWPDPTQEMLNDPRFEAIWQRIKSWDINVPGIYSGYCGANGNHVRAILDAVVPPVPSPDEVERLKTFGPLTLRTLVQGHLRQVPQDWTAEQIEETYQRAWEKFVERFAYCGFRIVDAMNRAVEPSYDDGQPYKDLLKDLVDLHSEEWALTGGGPGITERWEKAWVAAAELFEG